MKKKLSRIILPALVALALLIVLIVAVVRAFDPTAADPHAGHNHATADPHAGHDHTTVTTAIKHASESYTLTENKDGTYSFEVKNAYGRVMYSEKDLKEKPTFTAVNNGILEISCIDKNNFLTSWVKYCNIVNMDASGRITHALATHNGHVARVEYLSEKWLVFVLDPFGKSEPLAFVELTDLAIQETGNPEISAEKTADGKLKITYATADGNKTVTLDMNV